MDTATIMTIITGAVAITGGLFTLYKGWKEENRKLRDENRRDLEEYTELLRTKIQLEECQKSLAKAKEV